MNIKAHFDDILVLRIIQILVITVLGYIIFKSLIGEFGGDVQSSKECIKCVCDGVIRLNP